MAQPNSGRTKDPFCFMLKEQKCLSTKKLAVPWFQDPIWSIYRSTKSLKRILGTLQGILFPFLTDRWKSCGPLRQQEGKGDKGRFLNVKLYSGQWPMRGLEGLLKVSPPSFSSSHPSDHRVFPSMEFIWNRLQPFRMQSHLYTFLSWWQLICNQHIWEESFWEIAKQ